VIDVVNEPEYLQEMRRALGDRLATLRKAVGMSQAQLGRATYCDRTLITKVESGERSKDRDFWTAADRLLRADGALLAAYEELTAATDAYKRQHQVKAIAAARLKISADLVPRLPSEPSVVHSWLDPVDTGNDEYEALELVRRVTASDVGKETLTRLEAVVDELAIAYPKTPPQALLVRIRQHLEYVNQLLDARKTLAEHQRLLVVGGWLSLLGATVHIDLNQPAAAAARLKTAVSLAKHTGQDEIHAWCYETEAWRVLTAGAYDHALELSQAAQALAPAGSSVAIQSTAQEGRARARLGQSKETYAAITKVQQFVAPMKRPDHPEHHYRYDPDKSVAYTATTLAWVGDVAAEGYAREVIRRLAPDGNAEKWPRRVASANIDLSLALLVTNRLDEACDATLRAISSGRVVPSNRWRAAEIVRAVEAKGLPEAVQLREAYEELRRQ
jgi:transcriptional regulator with XRE-family HTH domain